MAERIAVVGGSSGIGEAVAARLSRRGAEVVIGGRREDALREARARLGNQVRAEVVDGADVASVERFFERTGPIDHLVICLSGRKGSGAFASLPLETLAEGFQEKVVAQLRVAQVGLKRLAASGSITFITAISARAVVPGGAGLGAINGALEVMVPTLSVELAPVRVNAVSPGVIDTPWWNGVPGELKSQYFEQSKARVPARRIGQPDDVAAAVELLVSNSFMTGTVLEVDGGARLV
ncbi:SDR family oxidoreductase [Vitiosangium sp. GDMCC 1.1324]|uniref:SDR family oxidoreductase n=1 Tax=Vitiosangium sp. (strain GDMCC 1.1324) TaxID=2138576 RepID=UPI000D334638|nr:SDR family oxidoreductase [Vitiosangium sp. GDMCC 1.1324]PTL81518.1 short-chain dehydrogenase [Vitiosangium sp. GDMCC 1.1324]